MEVVTILFSLSNKFTLKTYKILDVKRGCSQLLTIKYIPL